MGDYVAALRDPLPLAVGALTNTQKLQDSQREYSFLCLGDYCTTLAIGSLRL